MLQIFDANDPRVLDGTFDVFGFNRQERAAQARKEQHMAKRAKKKPEDDTRVTLSGPNGQMSSMTGAEFDAAVHRISTLPSNGDAPQSCEVAPGPISVGEAMRQAVEALGARTIDDGLTAGQLAALADCYERVVQETAAYAQKAEAAKVAKKAVESATEFLLSRVREFTHGAPLPLFDQQQAEADHVAMTDSASVPSPA